MNQHLKNNPLPTYVVCPQTFTRLVSTPSGMINTDPNTRWCYPIIDELPVLIPDRATQVDLETWQQLMNEHNQEALS